MTYENDTPLRVSTNKYFIIYTYSLCVYSILNTLMDQAISGTQTVISYIILLIIDSLQIERHYDSAGGTITLAKGYCHDLLINHQNVIGFFFPRYFFIEGRFPSRLRIFSEENTIRRFPPLSWQFSHFLRFSSRCVFFPSYTEIEPR